MKNSFKVQKYIVLNIARFSLSSFDPLRGRKLIEIKSGGDPSIQIKRWYSQFHGVGNLNHGAWLTKLRFPLLAGESSSRVSSRGIVDKWRRASSSREVRK